MAFFLLCWYSFEMLCRLENVYLKDLISSCTICMFMSTSSTWVKVTLCRASEFVFRNIHCVPHNKSPLDTNSENIVEQKALRLFLTDWFGSVLILLAHQRVRQSQQRWRGGEESISPPSTFPSPMLLITELIRACWSLGEDLAYRPPWLAERGEQRWGGKDR